MLKSIRILFLLATVVALLCGCPSNEDKPSQSSDSTGQPSVAAPAQPSEPTPAEPTAAAPATVATGPEASPANSGVAEPAPGSPATDPGAAPAVWTTSVPAAPDAPSAGSGAEATAPSGAAVTAAPSPTTDATRPAQENLTAEAALPGAVPSATVHSPNPPATPDPLGPELTAATQFGLSEGAQAKPKGPIAPQFGAPVATAPPKSPTPTAPQFGAPASSAPSPTPGQPLTKAPEQAKSDPKASAPQFGAPAVPAPPKAPESASGKAETGKTASQPGPAVAAVPPKDPTAPPTPPAAPATPAAPPAAKQDPARPSAKNEVRLAPTVASSAAGTRMIVTLVPRSANVPINPGAHEASEKFKAFTDYWLNKIGGSYIHSVKSMEIVPMDGKYVARYTELDRSKVTLDIKESNYDHTPFVGVMKYHEQTMESVGPTPEAAKSGKFAVAKRVGVTEIFRFAQGKWVE